MFAFGCLRDLRDCKRVLRQQHLDLVAQDVRRHGLGLHGTGDVQGTLVGDLARLRGQVQCGDLILVDGDPPETQFYVIVQMQTQFAF